jgi:SAM-dependent methyltransferase
MENIKSFLLKQSFQPDFISIFINPFYLIRKGIFDDVKENSHLFKGKLLDFGCGRKPYKNLFCNVSEYIGVDIEVSGHPHFNSQVDVFYDGKTLPFPDNYFDGIFCSEVIEHLFNKEELLPELYRVLKKDGIGLFTFPFSWPEHEKPYDFARYTTFASKVIFEKEKFKVVSITKTGNFIQVIFQYILLYLFSIIPVKSSKLKQFFLIPFTILLNLTGIIFSFILPKNKDLYFNNIVFIKK